jgi:K+-transporting ATPase A subunit
MSNMMLGEVSPDAGSGLDGLLMLTSRAAFLGG